MKISKFVKITCTAGCVKTALNVTTVDILFMSVSRRELFVTSALSMLGKNVVLTAVPCSKTEY